LTDAQFILYLVPRFAKLIEGGAENAAGRETCERVTQLIPGRQGAFSFNFFGRS